MDVTYPHPANGADAARAVWSRRLADEFWSGPVTPLTFSLLAPPMVAHMVERAFRAGGLDSYAKRPVFRLHASHVYVNAGLLADVVDLLPGLVRSDGLLELLTAEARRRVRPAGLLEGLPNAATIAARFLWTEPAWTPWQRAAAFDTACTQVRAEQTGLRPARAIPSPWALVAEVHRTQEALGAYLGVVSWGVVFAYVFYHLLGELVRRWAPELEAEAACLMVGLPGICSLQAHEEVLALGKRLAREPNRHDPRRDDLADVARRVAGDNGEIGNTFQHILAHHGHRLTGRDLLHPTWREAPELLIALALRSTHALDSEAPQPRPNPVTRRAAATAAIERRVGGGLDGFVRRGVFRATLAAAQRFCLVRENMRYHADFFLARLRELVLALGERLADDGVIADPSDVFFLDAAALRYAAAALEGMGTSSDAHHRSELRTRVAEHRTAFERDATSPPPLTLEAPAPSSGATRASLVSGGTHAVPAVASGQYPDLLTGEVGAPGWCEGPARVVHTAGDFDHVQPGDVIVAAYADPAWTPMLDLAAGLVLEAGGQLSHGAIVARELGIPALVNVHGAMRWARDGSTIRVDTRQACVRLAVQ